MKEYCKRYKTDTVICYCHYCLEGLPEAKMGSIWRNCCLDIIDETFGVGIWIAFGSLTHCCFCAEKPYRYAFGSRMRSMQSAFGKMCEITA